LTFLKQIIRFLNDNFIRLMMRYCQKTWIEAIALNYPESLKGSHFRYLFLKSRVHSIGDEFHLGKGCIISGYSDIVLGENSGIGQGSHISLGPGDKKLKIGSNVWVGPECYFRNANHKYEDLNKPIMDQGHDARDITIEDGVWIGARAVFLGGSHIGKNSIIAAGSVVSTKIPDNSVVAGNPARVVKRRS